MIQTLLVLEGGLVRGALAYVLSVQDDIEVVGERDDIIDIDRAVRTERPDVAVVDLNVVGTDEKVLAGTIGRCWPCRVLILVEPRCAVQLTALITRHATQVGFLNRDASPQRVIESIRSLHRGEPVLDGDVVVAALAATSPLTPRERDVLRTAADGKPVNEIASKLGLTPGTVRNHLSRIAAKTGANNRIQAVRTAKESGWI